MPGSKPVRLGFKSSLADFMATIRPDELRQDIINYVNWCEEEDLVKIYEMVRNKHLVQDGDSYYRFYIIENKNNEQIK